MDRDARRRTRPEGRGRSQPGGVPVHVALDSEHLTEWEGELAALERFGVTVRLGTDRPAPPKGSRVWLQFGPPGEAFMPVGGMVWRASADGLIAVLVSLSDEEFHRLSGRARVQPRPENTLATQPDHSAAMTVEERERALLALIHEGRKMIPTRPELADKIAEMRKKKN